MPVCIQDIEVEESIKRRKYLEEDEIEIAEIAMVQTPAAPPKPKNTLPNLYPPGSQLTPDKVRVYIYTILNMFYPHLNC